MVTLISAFQPSKLKRRGRISPESLRLAISPVRVSGTIGTCNNRLSVSRKSVEMRPSPSSISFTPMVYAPSTPNDNQSLRNHSPPPPPCSIKSPVACDNTTTERRKLLGGPLRNNNKKTTQKTKTKTTKTENHKYSLYFFGFRTAL